MAVPTNYDLQYDDYCGTYTPYNCELPSVCPDAMSYSANRRTFCRDIRMLDDLTVEELTTTKNLEVEDEYIIIDEIKYVVARAVSSKGGGVGYILAVDPTDGASYARAAQQAKFTVTL